MLFCPTCGTKNEDGAKFCGNCGTKLEGIASVPEVTSQAPKEETPEIANGQSEPAGSEPWKGESAGAESGRKESETPGNPPQENPPQETASSAPLRPSQLKKARDQHRTDQQGSGGAQITIKKPEINIQKYKGRMKRLSKMQIVVIAEAVCLLLVIGIFFGIASSQNDVSSVAKQYFQAYVDKDWSKVYDMTDFPEGKYLQKSQFVEMMENTEVPDITSFEIVADTESKNSGVQRSFLVRYTEKGKSADNRLLTLMKQKEKAMIFFDTWKVLPGTEVAENFQINIPKKAQASVDGVVLSEEDKVEAEGEGMDCYRVTLFAGIHNIQVALPWNELYEGEFEALAESGYSVEALQLTEEGETAIEVKMQEALEQVYQAALEQKKFSEIEDLFISDYQESCEESYDYLVSDLHDREAYKLKEVKFHDFKCESYTDNYQGWITSEMSYKYDMKYTYTYTSWRSNTPTVEDKIDDGNSYMSASFEYDGETYKIVSFSVRSVF